MILGGPLDIKMSTGFGSGAPLKLIAIGRVWRQAVNPDPLVPVLHIEAVRSLGGFQDQL